MPRPHVRSRTIISFIVIALFIAALGSVAGGVAHAQTASSGLDVGLDAAAKTGLAATDIRVVVANIIRGALGLMGILAVCLVLYGGYTYMTAGGNEEKVDQAKRILLNSGVGLVIILSAFGIVSFVLKSLVDATTGGGVGVEGGGSGGGGEDGSGGSVFSQAFYVTALPQGGQVCVRNTHPQIVFNKNVDLRTVDTAIAVSEKETGNIVPGKWEAGATQNTIVFNADGTCDGADGSDCLKAATEYVIHFAKPEQIKTAQEPVTTLNCRLKAGCNDVTFKTGDAIDRTAPTVSIAYPTKETLLVAGDVVPVQVTYTDDSGVQNVSLSRVNGANKEAVASLSFSGCKKSDTVTLNWPTKISDSGIFTLEARATDWAALSSAVQQKFEFKPNHCSNGQLETSLGEEKFGPPECGGECGACGGTVCKAATECASGSCINGVCAETMRITGFSPRSGAPGTFVTVNGYYFGTKPGKVFFANKEKPDVNVKTDWVEAQLVTCTQESSKWVSGQVVVRVPKDIAPYSHIKIESAPYIAADGTQKTNSDATTKHPEVGVFETNNVVRPNICSIAPLSGKAGAQVSVLGSAFGVFSAGDTVMFGDQKSVLAVQNNQPAWGEQGITVSVPSIESGSVGVRVVKNNIESNSVRFNVEQGVEIGAPIITEITPDRGPVGTYITITGKNFGNLVGTVSFKTGVNEPVVVGDMVFPKECTPTVWTDSKIMVKFPQGKGLEGKKFVVQVTTADNKVSSWDVTKNHVPETGDPTPGICSISPNSGPIPFPVGQTVQLFGDYFVTASNQTARVYFWNDGALDPKTTDGRTAVPDKNVVKVAANAITVVPPAGTISGPVSVLRVGDNKLSNAVQFSAADCRTSSNVCGDGQRCCLNGSQAGMCRATGSLCSDEKVVGGYMWRFATKSIPIVPRVVEQVCDASARAGKSLASPMPSVQWDKENTYGDSYNVCRSALVTVEFTTPLAKIDENNVKVYKCDSIEKGECSNAEKLTLSDDSFKLWDASSDGQKEQHQYIQIRAKSLWEKDAWYQVVLTNKIKALGTDGRVGASLASDQPCGQDGAYCFAFKGSGEQCALSKVFVTPYEYVTRFLEAPVKNHTLSNGATPVDYRAGGMSQQACIAMDVSSLPWNWSVKGTDFADIYGVRSGITAQVESRANTVGVTGLTNDAVPVTANTVVENNGATRTESGSSPLTVDLSNPEAIDHWPKCLEACTNDSVGVKFNISMSNKNVSQAVHLYKCADETCTSNTRQEVNITSEAVISEEDAGSVLIVTNASPTSAQLQPNTTYLVTISNSSTNPMTDGGTLWSRAKADDPRSAGKPYNTIYSWKFKTKQSACQVSRAEVVPKDYSARMVNDRAVYSVQPYSAPDSCSKNGQKLNPWSVNWAWTSSDQNVARLQTFATIGKNQNCTAGCIVKGSSIPSTGKRTAVCGNGIVEAGEDCDTNEGVASDFGPSKTFGCGLDCRFLGYSRNSKCGNGRLEVGEACDPAIPNTTGCTSYCLHTGSEVNPSSSDVSAAVCGNGLVNGKVGQGEDCDIGVPADIEENLSALNCSQKCLHTGTVLSGRWCAEHFADFGGFDEKEFRAACAKAVSQCGNNVDEPGEDVGCDEGDGKHANWCNDYCIANKAGHGDNCDPKTEGCSADGQRAGSSLQYDRPSVCGDGVVGTGEDAVCENSFTVRRNASYTDPWALATAVANTNPTTIGEKFVSTIKAETSVQGSASATGTFSFACGYKSDTECQAFGSEYGLGDNTCCFIRSHITNVVPKAKDTVCRNTAVQADFDAVIDDRTLSGNVLLARGTTAVVCPENSVDVSSLVTAAVAQSTSGSWYQKMWGGVSGFVKSLFGTPAEAALLNMPTATALVLEDHATVGAGAFAPPSKWCAGTGEQGAATITIDEVNTSTSRLNVSLKKALEPSTYYVLILREGLKDMRGVRLVSVGRNFVSKFKSNDSVCEVNSVTIKPTTYAFIRPNAQATFEAAARSKSGPIQPISGVYSWKYDWQPQQSAYIVLTNTSSAKNVIASRNQNGEEKVRAAAVVVDDAIFHKSGVLASGSSRVIVNLCEKPWPPRSVSGSTNSPFPFSDMNGNTSGFSNGVFNGSSIPKGDGGSFGDGYYNFQTFYCASMGGQRSYEELPYLRPSVQSINLKPDVGSCEMTGDTCRENAECGIYYGGTAAYVAPANKNGVCAGKLGDKTTVFRSATGDTVGCQTSTGVSECARDDFNSWVKNGKYEATCQPVPTHQGGKALQCYKYPPLKRFIFTNDTNGDAIGIQTFANPEHLTARQWYLSDKKKGGQGFVGNLRVTAKAGYPAAQDDNNFYVDVLNYSPEKKSMYSTIYQFSISENAKPATRQVFDQMLQNLSFNTNIEYSDGYCGTSNTNPSFTTRCVSDLDCSSGQVCVDQVGKMKRNYARLRDLKEIESTLQSYAIQHAGRFPAVNVGSYLSGQSLSVWDWAGLASLVNTGLPKDPIDKLGEAGTCKGLKNKFCTRATEKTVCGPNDTCVLHDPRTGWSTEDRRFSFACAEDSLAYRYTKTDAGYTVANRFEETGLNLDAGYLAGLAAGFHFDNINNFPGITRLQNSICDSVGEIRNMNNGTCGDGQINPGEACDPVGSISYDKSGCSLDGSGAMTSKTCNEHCQWDAPKTGLTCADLKKCGNGKLDIGEKCDDGAQNGTWNKCSYDCQSVGKASLTVTVGYCGDGEEQKPQELCEWSNAPASAAKCSTGPKIGTFCSSNADCTVNLSKEKQIDYYGSGRMSSSGTSGRITGVVSALSQVKEMKEIKCSVNPQGTFNCNTYFTNTNNVESYTGGVMDVRKCNPDMCYIEYNEADADTMGLSDMDSTGDIFQMRVSILSGDGICDNPTFTRTQVKYGSTKKDSCNWDCKSYGPYCGDGIVQSEFGEECDGDLTCPIGGVSGVKKCSATCKFVDGASVSWWPMTSAITGGVVVDRNGVNKGSCTSGKCPVYQGINGEEGSTYFNGNSFVTVPQSEALMPTSTLSIEAWVKLDQGGEEYGRIVDKGSFGKIGGGYELEKYYKSNNIAFNIWGADGKSVLSTNGTSGAGLVSKSGLIIGKWTHVVATYEWQPIVNKEILKIFLDGNLDAGVFNENVAKPSLIANKQDLYIGRGGNDSNYFKGNMKHVRILNRVLQPAEIKNRFEDSWPCAIPKQQTAYIADAGTCGDGVVNKDSGEVCDEGMRNGLKCTPKYAESCTFCQANSGPGKNDGCRYTYQIKSEQYCGNHVIEAAEVCEINESGTTTVKTAAGVAPVTQCSAENDPDGIFSKGTKVCTSDCTRVTVSETGSENCLRCGIDMTNGSPVVGTLLNVLNPKSNNPLDLDLITNTEADVSLRAGDKVLSKIKMTPNNRVYAFKTGDGQKDLLFNTNPVCSNGSGATYKLSVKDSKSLFDINIAKEPLDWQYDVMLSPTMVERNLKDVNSKIRIVLSWVGEQRLNLGLVRMKEGKLDSIEDGSLNPATAENALRPEKLSSAYWNIWYHDFGMTDGGLKVESMTIDRLAIEDGGYKVYVRFPESSLSMAQVANISNARIDVYGEYYPQLGGVGKLNADGTIDIEDAPKYSLPSQTYYLKLAGGSDNKKAFYWHAFTVKKFIFTEKSIVENAAFLENGVLNTDFPNGRIVSGVNEMK